MATHYYTGLDVSMDKTDIVTVDERGKVVFESSATTDPQSLHVTLKEAGFPIQKISLESGSWSHWLVRELSSLGWNITCLGARSISPFLSLKTNKTDRNDNSIPISIRLPGLNEIQVYYLLKMGC